MTIFKISRARKWRVVPGIVAVTIFLVGHNGFQAFAQEPDAFSATVSETTKRIVTSGTHSGIRWQRFPYYVDELESVYGPAGYGLVWFDGTHVTPKARDLIAELAKAEDDGLDPEDYDARMLAETLAAIKRGEIKDPEQLALFDTALTIAFLRYVSDLHIGRVNPKNLHMGLDIQANKYDLATVLEQALAEGHIASLIANVQPVIPVYDRLKQILPKYRALAADPSLRPLPVVNLVVNPGDSYAGTPALAHLLVAVGDLSSADLPATDPQVPVPVYEGPVVDGVKRFQVRHGLDADGVIGPATVGALNRPMSQRLRSIEMALERLRWLPFLGDEPFVIVDIPAFHLWAFDTGKLGNPDITMNVIVGKAIDKTQTPIFSGKHIYGVRKRGGGQLVCLEFDGNEIWNSGKDRYGHGPYVMADGLILVMDDHGWLSMVEATPDGYQRLGRSEIFPDGHDAWGPMALVDGRLIVRDMTRMACLDIARR